MLRLGCTAPSVFLTVRVMKPKYVISGISLRHLGAAMATMARRNDSQTVKESNGYSRASSLGSSPMERHSTPVALAPAMAPRRAEQRRLYA